MTESDETREQIEDAVRQANDSTAYVMYEGDGEIILDGRFTLAQLEAIVQAMRNPAPLPSQIPDENQR